MRQTQNAVGYPLGFLKVGLIADCSIAIDKSRYKKSQSLGIGFPVDTDQLSQINRTPPEKLNPEQASPSVLIKRGRPEEAAV